MQVVTASCPPGSGLIAQSLSCDFSRGRQGVFECENVLQGSGPHSEDEARSFASSKSQPWINKLSLRRELQGADLLPAS